MSAPRRALRLPRQPGVSGWAAILPARAPCPALAGRQTADVAIIGAGFAGLSAARRLAQLDPALRIAVLEAGRVAEGAAGRNTGFMIDLPHDLASDDYAGSGDDRAQIALNRQAIGFAAEAVEELGLDAETFAPAGKINAAATEAGERANRGYSAHLGQLGEAHEMLDAAAMREITGTGFYRAGLFTPGAAMIQPARYIRGLADGLAARAGRVTLHEDSPVREIARAGDAWALQAGAGTLTAPRVILAVNGHAESFGFFARRLMHVFTYASMTRALTAEEAARLGGQARWGVTPADPMGTTVRRISGTGGDRIVVRSRFTFEPSMTVSDAQVARAGRLHDRRFAERFPMLAGVGMAHRWAGHLCLSRNGVPAFGEVEPGIVAACCQNGLGTVRGTLAGMAAAEATLGRETGRTRALAGAEAPARLPPEPVASIGANAYLRYKEWRAGRE
ncbi:FAD-binding oxidoreductase [Paralimibaculum aggregatum]|uniref:FAD-binding oxidoreductase n=1 Tax=Paralimibaculum aggregatum TaxID=3036245 RepID=A0ABQ6LR80_9RHOB|nr:FAD-binding oxidoreductase [Limibaculum sp. NKW23]GMG84403.1 FAD-binding oxidoreductase [Limibaculum sp. NKW23]